jgi:hypothetical protein
MDLTGNPILSEQIKMLSDLDINVDYWEKGQKSGLVVW